MVALGIHFDNCGSLHAPAPGLLVYLCVYVGLGQEGLDITLVFDGQKARLMLSEGEASRSEERRVVF